MLNNVLPANGGAMPIRRFFNPDDFSGYPQDRIRREVSDEIERMIAFLDFVDGDENLELEPDDESYLAGCIDANGRFIDLEADDSDSEPSLGWSKGVNQEGEAYFGCTASTFDVDREEEDEA